MKLHELQTKKTVNTRNNVKDWSRACKNKKKFFSKRDAQAAIEAGTIPESDTLEPYKCSFCTSWHIGHSRKYYRQLRGLSERSRVPDSQRKAYLTHIKRLQEEKAILTEALAAERFARQQAYAWYQKRLRSWWWRTIDAMLLVMRDYPKID